MIKDLIKLQKKFGTKYAFLALLEYWFPFSKLAGYTNKELNKIRDFSPSQNPKKGEGEMKNEEEFIPVPSEVQSNLIRLYKGRFKKVIEIQRKEKMKMFKRLSRTAKQRSDKYLMGVFDGQYDAWKFLDKDINEAIKNLNF